jgi:quercetin dioxygenase-like cupin family protein
MHCVRYAWDVEGVWSHSVSALVERSKVFALEEAMKRECELIELPVRHHFAKGVYGRELFIPKGTTLTGKIHKYTQLNILVCGELSVLTDDGVKRVKPPFVVVSPAGTKRAAYAHEDSIWLTVHGTEETDVDLIEKTFIAQTEQEYLEFAEKLQLSSPGGEEETLCLGQPPQ